MNDTPPPSEPEDVETVLPGYLGDTPPYDQPPQKGQRTWVDRPEQLLAAVNILKQASVVAIDAEFAQIRSWTQNEGTTSAHRLALLQLAIDHQCFVVDALRLSDLSPVTAVVENPAITVLLHGAAADLRVMGERDLHIAHYYDLEATSRSIFGQHESSLAAMLQRALDVRLDKSLQRTDWARRPLPPAMIAYAARDAEMTLALYHWLDRYFPWALSLHENTNQEEPVAAWIEPFLRGTSLVPADVAVAEAIEQRTILDREQLYVDCRTALATLTQPMRRSRLLRLIADLSLIEMAPEIEQSLQALTSEERAAAVRALSRLDVEHSKSLIHPLLQDPVYEVRKAVSTALRGSVHKESRRQWTTPVRSTDGTRTWSIGETAETRETANSDESDWKARLRSLMGE